ncbi:MAG: diguanylate cyclase [Schwartzia sp.]|nr:diguanylate cyclase [Schwartzia sp. (in: firmicutes)]
MPKKPLIMMILPESPIAREFRGLLSEEYEVISADNEEQGLLALSHLRDQVSAVLLDLDLSRQNGFSFFKMFSRDVLYAAIPVIATLPRTPTEKDMACLDMGAADILAPPCEGKLLLKRLSNVIRAKDSATFYEIERMLQVLPSNIYLKDAEGKYIFATHYWHHLDKSDDPDWTIRGKTDPEIRKDKENARLAYESDKKILATGKGTRYIIEVNADGQREFLELIKEPVRDDDGNIKGIVGLINNVTEQQLMKLELERRAKTDELTGLFNRRYYQEYIAKIHAPENLPISFVSADCNGLKYINDTYGHLVGDEYIRMSALLFRMVLPERAGIFRMGGDEFALVLPKTDAEEARRLVAEMQQKQSLFRIRNEELSVAFGFSTIQTEANDLDICIAAADQEMYRNKKQSKRARA